MIYGNVGRLVLVDVVIELFKTKFMPILLYGLDACPVSSRQLRSLNHVVISCGRKLFHLISTVFKINNQKWCLKVHQNAFGQRLRPGPRWGAYGAATDAL